MDDKKIAQKLRDLGIPSEQAMLALGIVAEASMTAYNEGYDHGYTHGVTKTASVKKGAKGTKGAKQWSHSPNFVLGCISVRRSQAQRERDDAIAKKEWSKVPGWDGIDIGLMAAERIIEESSKA